MNESQKSLLLYIAKCVTATLIVFLFARYLHRQDVGWCLVSVVIVLSPDSKDAVPFALSRIGANIVGGLSSLVWLSLGVPRVLAFCLSYSLAIAVCHSLRLTASTRSALAAVTIILMNYQPEHPQDLLWENVLARVFSVAGGCAVALLVTLIFHRRLSAPANESASDVSE